MSMFTREFRASAVVAVGLTVVPAPFCALAHADSTRYGVDAEYDHFENVNRAAIENEKQSDDAIAVEGYAMRSMRLSPRSGLVARGGLRMTQYAEFGDLSQIAVLGRVSYRIQPSPGFSSPWVELKAGVDFLKHSDSEIRDGHILSASASVGKYATDRIRIEGGAGLEQRKASEGEVFQLSNWKAWGALDYKLAPKTTLYGAATLIDGDQAFALVNFGAYPSTYAYATASGRDPAFASAFNGVAPWIYRIDARTTVFDLGANIAFTGNHALDFGYSTFDSKAKSGGGRYDGSTLRIGYLYRFR
jgi:hypothetical protein